MSTEPHDNVLLNRGIDSDLLLCQTCGEEYAKEGKREGRKV